MSIHDIEPADGPTELCALMEKYGSDKGSVHARARHNYTRFYHSLFAPYRDRVLRLFELGIFQGSSLRAWRDFFPSAEICGADIERSYLFSEERIRAFCCDERSITEVQHLWSVIGEVDVIIDDGLHDLESNHRFWVSAWPWLKPGGLYIVEDLLAPADYEQWRDQTGGRIVSIPHMDTPDNHLLVMQKESVRRWDSAAAELANLVAVVNADPKR